MSVRLGDYALAKDEGRLAALGLGSCVAIILYDPTSRVGAMGHIVLPSKDLARDRSNAVKFADTAVPFLVGEMRRAGAHPDTINARLVGGACMFASLIPPGSIHVGKRNVNSCRAALETAGVPTVAEDVGAEHGRSVVFDVADGTVTVRGVGRGQKRV